jgi:hypothetical protein
VHDRCCDQNFFGGEVLGSRRERLYGCRESNALKRFFAQGIQTGEGKHKMCATLGVNKGVKLVQYDGVCCCKYILSSFAGKH